MTSSPINIHQKHLDPLFSKPLGSLASRLIKKGSDFSHIGATLFAILAATGACALFAYSGWNPGSSLATIAYGIGGGGIALGAAAALKYLAKQKLHNQKIDTDVLLTHLNEESDPKNIKRVIKALKDSNQFELFFNSISDPKTLTPAL